MLKKTLLTLTLLAAMVSLAGAKEIDNPEYLSWKPFKSGAMVKMEHVSKMAGTETKTVKTTTLKELTAEKAVLTSQTTLYVMGNEMKQPAQEEEIPAKVDVPDVPAGTPKPDLDIEEGEETLSIAGRQVACTWVKSTVKMGGNTVVSKVWSSDAVPGGMVKMESTTKGAMTVETTMVVTEFKTE